MNHFPLSRRFRSERPAEAQSCAPNRRRGGDAGFKLGARAQELTVLVIEGRHGQGGLHVSELDFLPLPPASPEI